MKSLPLFHRIAGQRVVVLGDGIAAEAKRRLVARAGGIPVGEAEAHGAKLAFVALENEGEARAAVRRLTYLGLLVNVPDRPDLCDFTVPSVLDRDPVLIAIGTGGASAGLAKALRLRLETLVPQGLGAFARAMQAARARVRQRWPDAGQRRRVLDAAMAEHGPLDPLRDDVAEAVEPWLAGAGQAAQGTGRYEFMLASDDPEDLTLRQARLLGSADAILHDQAVAAAILDRARADAQRIVLPLSGPEPEGLVIVLRRAAD